MALGDAGSTALIANIALPFNLMVVAPLAFLLLYVRPRKKSPILVLPIIYLGAWPRPRCPSKGRSPLCHLLVAAAAVDVAVLCLEVPRVARSARALNDEATSRQLPPSGRFRHCSEGILGGSLPARMLAAELTMW